MVRMTAKLNLRIASMNAQKVTMIQTENKKFAAGISYILTMAPCGESQVLKFALFLPDVELTLIFSFDTHAIWYTLDVSKLSEVNELTNKSVSGSEEDTDREILLGGTGDFGNFVRQEKTGVQ